MSNINYPFFAKRTLTFLREESDADEDIKLFTHIVEFMLNGILPWKRETIRESYEWSMAILMALEKWEEQDFKNEPREYVNAYRHMLIDLHDWLEDPSRNDNVEKQ